MAGFTEGFLAFTDIQQVFGNHGINRCFIKTSVSEEKKEKVTTDNGKYLPLQGGALPHRSARLITY